MDVQDKQLQSIISVTLRTGVLVAVALGLLGGAVFLAQHHGDPVSFKDFAGAHILYASPAQTAHEALHLGPSGTYSNGVEANNRGLAIAQIGIICLLLTPIIRVALSIFGFALERDFIYVGITVVVLATLTCSLLLH
jgi:uncharacterized membrane protein